MKTIITIEARIGATRLPGKMLKDCCGQPILEHVIQRVRRSNLADQVVVASTDNPNDQVIEDLCHRINCPLYRGSENDITSRLLQTAQHFHADVIVQVWGDCVLHDASIIDQGIALYHSSNVDFVSNRLIKSFPAGLEVQVFSRKVLEVVDKVATLGEDREHGTSYIYTHPNEFSMKNFTAEYIYCPTKRWLLDYPQDLDFIRAVYQRLWPINPAFGFHDVLRLLEAQPELEKINSMYPVDLKSYPFFENLDCLRESS